MLALSRRRGESIQIKTAAGEVINVHVVHVGQTSVRIGVDAPGDWTILRSELLARDSTEANGRTPEATEGR